MTHGQFRDRDNMQVQKRSGSAVAVLDGGSSAHGTEATVRWGIIQRQKERGQG